MWMDVVIIGSVPPVCVWCEFALKDGHLRVPKKERRFSAQSSWG